MEPEPWYKKWWGILLIVFSGLLLFTIVTSSPDEPEREPAPEQEEPQRPAPEEPKPDRPAPEEPKPAQWTEVASFSGSSNQQTDTFTITSDRFRVTWSSDGGDLSLFIADLVRPGDDFPTEQLANIANESGSDTTFVYESGTFYIDVTALSTNWTIVVEEEQ
jgi:hypothetical protein